MSGREGVGKWGVALASEKCPGPLLRKEGNVVAARMLVTSPEVGSTLFFTSLSGGGANHLSAENKAVFITGCDSGFGHALALKLDRLKMTVFAGCLDDQGKGAAELRDKCSERLHVLKLDVTNKDDIEAVSKYIENHVKEEGLWGLVNNAGVWWCAELDMLPENILHRVMDVNLFGAVRVTSKLLPLVKKAQGRVVNVSSLLGRMSMEGSGAYAMSKHAMVAYTNTLRLEMKKHGVGVSIVEPAGFLTGNLQEQTLSKRKEELWASLDEEKRQYYGRGYLDALYSHVQSCFQKYPREASPVVRCIRSGLLSKRPREQYPCGTGAETLVSVYPLLPVWLADYIAYSMSIFPNNLRPGGAAASSTKQNA
ncbi:corticosteroid 11-beta-dehydrogenase isozyme 2 [Elysia marginata]|uniref:Corticosteroid 11-beta-dehydrogenase isozyme 2 n=1 Tax=Elysia marginata TaxID=1093978 RepID=A0AAV4GK08_9GAST|nr:corticosteroid 11-beta-dehydrogenase isozyme 2 [Elysia marginata]